MQGSPPMDFFDVCAHGPKPNSNGRGSTSTNAFAVIPRCGSHHRSRMHRNTNSAALGFLEIGSEHLSDAGNTASIASAVAEPKPKNTEIRSTRAALNSNFVSGRATSLDD